MSVSVSARATAAEALPHHLLFGGLLVTGLDLDGAVGRVQPVQEFSPHGSITAATLTTTPRVRSCRPKPLPRLWCHRSIPQCTPQ
jgi:hypothetical protein